MNSDAPTSGGGLSRATPRPPDGDADGANGSAVDGADAAAAQNHSSHSSNRAGAAAGGGSDTDAAAWRMDDDDDAAVDGVLELDVDAGDADADGGHVELAASHSNHSNDDNADDDDEEALAGELADAAASVANGHAAADDAEGGGTSAGSTSTITTKKPRKPYTITKNREIWTADEHERFLEALRLYHRDWKRIEQHVGSKNVIQIRSHAQKHFLKVQKHKTGEHVPPPRKRRGAAPNGGGGGDAARSGHPPPAGAAAAAANAATDGVSSATYASSPNLRQAFMPLTPQLTPASMQPLAAMNVSPYYGAAPMFAMDVHGGGGAGGGAEGGKVAGGVPPLRAAAGAPPPEAMMMPSSTTEATDGGAALAAGMPPFLSPHAAMLNGAPPPPPPPENARQFSPPRTRAAQAGRGAGGGGGRRAGRTSSTTRRSVDGGVSPRMMAAEAARMRRAPPPMGGGPMMSLSTMGHVGAPLPPPAMAGGGSPAGLAVSGMAAELSGERSRLNFPMIYEFLSQLFDPAEKLEPLVDQLRQKFSLLDFEVIKLLADNLETNLSNGHFRKLLLDTYR